MGRGCIVEGCSEAPWLVTSDENGGLCKGHLTPGHVEWLRKRDEVWRREQESPISQPTSEQQELEHRWDESARCEECGLYMQHQRLPENRWCPGPCRDSYPPKDVPRVQKPACETCGGNGFVMIQVGDFAGHERRDRCATCNGVGAKRCNAEGRAGDLCKLAPGHDGEHASERGVTWHGADGRAMPLPGRWYTLMNDGAKWEWQRAGTRFESIEKDNGREIKKADHFCGVQYPPHPDRSANYAIFCWRDKRWIDVTDVVVRGFVVPYEEHVLPPTPHENGAAHGDAPRPASEPEPLGDIVTRILKDLRSLVRAATK